MAARDAGDGGTGGCTPAQATGLAGGLVSSIDHHRETVGRLAGEIPRLRRFAQSLARDPALADDLVQECLERALTRLHLWQPGTNLRAWLFTILRNLHINGVRRPGAFVALDDAATAAIPGPPGNQVHRLELRDLRRALKRLPKEQRQVLWMIGVEGRSYAETAQSLRVSVGTIKSRLSRGRRALHRLMEGEGTGAGAGAELPPKSSPTSQSRRHSALIDA